MSRPNLLLITTDQQRYDALGINGNSYLQTQNLDALAARGVNFSRGYVTCPSCIAARRTILTGQAPATHGLVGYDEDHSFDPPFTLPGLLSRAGYQTQLVGKLHQQPQRRRFGFDNMILSNAPSYWPDSAWLSENDYVEWLREQGVKAPPSYHGISGNGRLAKPWSLDEWYHHTTWVTTEAIEFLTRKRDPSCPFFLHLSYSAPHPPLVPPQAYYDRYSRIMDHFAPAIGQWAPQGPARHGIVPDNKSGPFPLHEIQNATAGYYGLINHVDDQIGRALAAFYSYGGPRGREPMWIIFTSDHGEMLGDHHLFRKSLGYEGSAHVPFFISGRNVDINPGASGALVGLEDLLPTFCDLAGVDVPEGVDGRSIMPIVQGQSQSVRDEIHGEHSGGSMANHFLVRGRHKYIWYAKTNEEQIFDLEADPQELHDVSADETLLCQLRERMAGCLQGRTDYTYDVSRLRPLGNATPRALSSSRAQL